MAISSTPFGMTCHYLVIYLFFFAQFLRGISEGSAAAIYGEYLYDKLSWICTLTQISTGSSLHHGWQIYIYRYNDMFVFNNIETDYMNFQILRPPCLSYVGIVLMVNEPDRWIIKIWQEQKSTFKPWTEKQQVGWIRKGIIDDYGPPTIPGIVKQNILQPPST